MSSFALKAEGLGKRYRIRPAGDVARIGLWSRPLDAFGRREDMWALRGVDFEVRPGEVVGVVGHNGAGKSTLLKVLSRITDPTEGRALVRGRLGSLLEVGTGFHPELTGRENIYLNGAILGMKKHEIDQRLDRIVAFAEVERYLGTPVKRYSSGMYLRLAFAVAAYVEPDVLLVDEVLAVGDVEFQRKCLGTLDEAGREGRTVLFVSHNMPMVKALCTRGILIKQGRVEADGPIDEILDAYTNEFEESDGQMIYAERADAVAQFTRVALRNSAGETTARVRHSEPFSVEFEYVVHREIHGNRLYWILARADGGEVVISGTDDSPVPFGDTHAPGRYCATVSFPGGLLNGGRHTFRQEIRARNGWSYDYQQGFAFDVVDDTDFGPLMPGGFRNGAILQQLTWQERKLD